MKPIEGDFVETLLEVTKIVESPELFLRWAGYSTIATVLRDNVWLEFAARRTKIFPNMYIMIIAESGMMRKASPLKIALSLVKSIRNTKIIEGRASIQGILKELSKVETLPNGFRLEGANGLIYSEEFAASLVIDPIVVKILTDIYDHHEDRAIYLKSEDPVKLKNVVVNLLTGTNMPYLSSMFSATDFKGGFVGRVILLFGDKPRKRNLGLSESDNKAGWTYLEERIKKIAQIKGRLTYSDWGIEYFEDWYEHADLNDSSETGFEARLHTHAMKLSMVKSASSGVLKTKIAVEAIHQSIYEMLMLRTNYHKILTGSNMQGNNITNAVNAILRMFLKNMHSEIEHSELSGYLINVSDANTIDQAINSLKAANLVYSKSKAGSTYYGFTEKSKKMYGGLKEKSVG